MYEKVYIEKLKLFTYHPKPLKNEVKKVLEIANYLLGKMANL